MKKFIAIVLFSMLATGCGQAADSTVGAAVSENGGGTATGQLITLNLPEMT